MPLSKARDRERKRVGNLANLIQPKSKGTFQPNRTQRLASAGIKLDGNVILDRKPVQPGMSQILQYRQGVQYKEGTKLIYQGQVITVPELDADGRPMFED